MRYLLALTLLLPACAHRTPVVAYGNEVAVQVDRLTPRNERQGFALAEQHCRRHGKVPRIASDQGRRITFDCITPSE